MRKTEVFNDWLFHYNPYQEMWYAFKREHHLEYFNGEHKNVLKSDNIKTLEQYIQKNG